MAENGIIGNMVLWTILYWVRLDVSTIHNMALAVSRYLQNSSSGRTVWYFGTK